MSASQGKKFQVIGTNPQRTDVTDKVTGRALYGADIRLPGMLFGAVLRSPHAHARIISIDTSAAEALPGVRAVVTAADLPEVGGGLSSTGEGAIHLRYQSENVLARGRALYFGHALAGVAATSPHIAEEAARLIRVTYEILPAALSVRDAMRPDAPILLEELRTDELGVKGSRPSNIAAHFRIRRGDVEAGFAQAKVIIEREFVTSAVHQGYIEPQNGSAVWAVDGQLTIWCSAQGAFGVRDQVSEVLGIPVSKIRVVPLEIGGGFGGKNNVYLEPVAALLSRKSGGKPVKMSMSRAEVLAATGPTSDSVIRVKMGADGQGRIVAAQAFMAYGAGAFPGSPVSTGADTVFSAYRIENVLIDGYDVVNNHPRAAAYRAPGGTNALFPTETIVDELAEQLSIDPLEFRLMNVAREGDRRPDGMIYGKIGFQESLEAARQHPHYRAPLGGPNRGRGVACSAWGNYGGTSSVSASLNSDGSISLVLGSVDLSTGRTAAAIQLAETLGVPVESIRPRVGDTDAVGYTEGTYGSRTTYATGWAVFELGRKLIGEVRQRAAEFWGVEAEMAIYERGCLTCGVGRMTLADLAARIDQTSGPVVAAASVRADQWGPSFAVHIADVEVDPETGKVQVLRYTAVQDVGTAVYPQSVEGQIQGATAQGIGWALHEEYFYDEAGSLANASFLDYRIPTALDLPMIDTLLVEVPYPNHPYGVRGAGENSIVPPAGALANAIHRAVGVRLSELPMSPGRILQAVTSREQG